MKRKMKTLFCRNFFIPAGVFCLLGFSACVSTYTALQKLHLGSSKDTVRTVVGRPFSVGRVDGKDRWTYQFKWQAQEYTRDILFEDGLVQKIGPMTPYPNYEKKMLEADSLDDYETNAMLFHQQKQRGFRTINAVQKKPKKYAPAPSARKTKKP